MDKELQSSIASAAVPVMTLAGRRSASTQSEPADSIPLNAFFNPDCTRNRYFNRSRFGIEQEAAARGGSDGSDGSAAAGPIAQVPIIRDGLIRGVNVIGGCTKYPKAGYPKLRKNIVNWSGSRDLCPFDWRALSKSYSGIPAAVESVNIMFIKGGLDRTLAASLYPARLKMQGQIREPK